MNPSNGPRAKRERALVPRSGLRKRWPRLSSSNDPRTGWVFPWARIHVRALAGVRNPVRMMARELRIGGATSRMSRCCKTSRSRWVSLMRIQVPSARSGSPRDPAWSLRQDRLPARLLRGRGSRSGTDGQDPLPSFIEQFGRQAGSSHIETLVSPFSCSTTRRDGYELASAVRRSFTVRSAPGRSSSSYSCVSPSTLIPTDSYNRVAPVRLSASTWSVTLVVPRR